MPRASRPLLLLAVLLVAAPARASVGDGSPPREPLSSETSIDEVAERVLSLRDQAAPEDIRLLGEAGTLSAAETLAEAYDGMASIAARRSVVRALGAFHGTEAETFALTRLDQVARTSGDERIRDAAVDSLGAGAAGAPWLAGIVDSAAADELRVRALRLHTGFAGPEDEEWYEELFERGADGDPNDDDKRKKRRRKDEDAEPVAIVHVVPELRALAFEHIAPSLSKGKLIDATEDRHNQVRRAALLALESVDGRAAARRAEDLVEKTIERSNVRALAATVLVRERGARACMDLIEIANKATTSEELRATIAELVSKNASEAATKKLARFLGKSRASRGERLFALDALPPVDDDKVHERVIAEVEGEDTPVRIAAARWLGERRIQDGRDPLRAVLDDKANSVELRATALEALGRLGGGDSDRPLSRDVEADLERLVTAPETELRNAALQMLPVTRARLELFAGALAHGEWSTRYQALRALEQADFVEVVPLLIDRLQIETGRLREDIGEVLFQLTAQPFGDAAANWRHWWDNFKTDDFQLATAEDLAEARRKRDERAAAMVTRAEFFGIELVSHRIVFVIDVSGSMAETLRPRFEGDVATVTRLEAAVEQIHKSIAALHPDAQVNVIAFSSGVTPWRKDGIGVATAGEREELLEWVDRLGALGGTNLYDAMRAAFSDLDADTIVVLSDGEPSQGEVVDPFEIREHVRQWNERRGVEIHAVSIGSSLDVLEWFAEDSGGEYRWMR